MSQGQVSNLSSGYVLKEVYDPATDGLKVTSVNGFISETFDRIDVTYPSATTEVYAYSMLGSSVGSVQVTYTDATKASLLSIEKL